MKKRKLLAALALLAMAVSLLTACGQKPAEETAAQYGSIEDLTGKRIGVVTGTVFDAIIKEHNPNAVVEYLNTTPDLPAALAAGKIDAYVLDEPIFRSLADGYPEHHIIEMLSEEDYAYVFPKGSERHEKLCAELNEFLAKAWTDGTIEAAQERWFKGSVSSEPVDLASLTGENGTLRYATSTDAGATFDMIADGGFAGYEIDLLASFCREYGYALEIDDYSFSGMIAAVTAGKADLAGCTVAVTEERRESMLFSEPNYHGGTVLVVKSAAPAPTATVSAAGYSSAQELAGKRIGVLTGSVFDVIAQEKIPDITLEYLNSDPDLAAALNADRIDAYVVDEPIFRSFADNYPDQYIIEKFSEADYAYIFPKDSERHEKLCAELNEFLVKAWADGTVDAVRAKWLKSDVSGEHIDLSGLTGENGTLRFATNTDGGGTFDFIADGEYAGYDIDLLVRFCEEYGYALEIDDYSFSGMLAAVSGGKADIGACTITVTEERRESMLFSEPNYHGGTVLIGKHSSGTMAAGKYSSAQELAGRRIGVVTGSIFDLVAQEHIKDPQLEYLNAMSDLPVALESGKVDAYIVDEPIYRNISGTHPDEYIIEQLTHEDYAFLFPKNSEKHAKLCAEMNEFLAVCREDGTLQELAEKWIDGDYTQASIDFDGLSGENGSLQMAISSEIGAPFTFVNNGEFAGYDIEVAVRFCRAHGYALEITDYNPSSLLAATTIGKADIAAGCISVTAERQESILFSDPDYVGGIVLVGSSASAAAPAAAEESSDTGIAASFEKTFIRESRWKLFASGIGVTLIITALSTVFGTALGFGIYMLYRKGNRIFVGAVNVLMDILEKTPVVVILMILYYIIFGKSDLSGVWVSIVGFSVMFACSFVGTIKVGVMAVDRGQTEASLALGFTDTRGFLRVILPQAAKHFLPNYKGQIVSLLKDTAVVGYIAVQDLTKVGDIVRSRTYEAFFPLVATAIIYFLLAWLLTLLVRRIEFRTDPTKRSREMILKGVKTK